MEIYTSYFYQVRFMKPYHIPLSTAVWDPKWFHANRGQDYHFKDKNGVYNGLRAPVFAPGKDYVEVQRPARRARRRLVFF